MYTLRPFRNSDPPGLVKLWSRQPPYQGIARPLGIAHLDQNVFGKPYFDRQGLLVATRDDQIVGFAHGGFGPNEERSELDTQLGVTSMVMLQEEEWNSSLGVDLLTGLEEYLQGRGSKVLYAGEIRPLIPFYLGLYGGSELPGTLESDTRRLELYLANGYQEIDRVIVLRRDLSEFRPRVSRRQIQHRRRMQLEMLFDPPCTSWWEACTDGAHDRVRFEVREKGQEHVIASMVGWNIEPLASSWGRRAVGLTHVDVDPDSRREGFATFMLGEAFLAFQTEGVTLVEVQVMQHNTTARELYSKLGFEQVDEGIVLRKNGKNG